MWISLISAVCLVLLTAGPFLLQRYDRETMEDDAAKQKRFRFLYPFGLWLQDCLERITGNADSTETEWAQALYVREQPAVRLRLRRAGCMLRIWGCAEAACLICLLFSASAAGKKPQETDALERPSFGETESYELLVDGLTEESLAVTVAVAGREPEEEQMKAVFDRTLETVIQESLGRNASQEEVRTDLALVSVTDYGIRVQWRSLDPEQISSNGVITAEYIPEKGVAVGMMITLSYASYSESYEVPFRLMPPVQDEAWYVQKFQEALKQSNENSKTAAFWKLPGSVEGKTLNYREKEPEQPWILPLLLIAIACLSAVSDRQNMKQEYEKRSRELEREYPAFVFQLGTMLGCGLTLVDSWNRILQLYQEKKQREPEWKQALYEEMITTRLQLQAGKGEAQVYREFGQRCKCAGYRRLGSYLEQNIRQGSAGISRMLETEMAQALEERRNQALRLGEELNTRLLLPMTAMLGVVLAVLVAPAFLAM